MKSNRVHRHGLHVLAKTLSQVEASHFVAVEVHSHASSVLHTHIQHRVHLDVRSRGPVARRSVYRNIEPVDRHAQEVNVILVGNVDDPTISLE